MGYAIRLLSSAIACGILFACSGGSNSVPDTGVSPPSNPGVNNDSGCSGNCANAQSFLTEDDIRKVIAQAVSEAQAQNVKAVIVVIDRVGNVLGSYRMDGVPFTVRIGTNRGVLGGAEDINIATDFAAIAKAITAVYFSSEGNAFTSRTAGQIAQEHFNPDDRTSVSGPLFGVQFSNLPCSDISQRFISGGTSPGPHRSPIGLSPDPGSVPLYKAGVPVGAIGVAGTRDAYTTDENVGDRDRNLDEYVAMAGSFGFSAPVDRRADSITAGGLSLRYTDVEFRELARDPAQAPAFSSIPASVGAIQSIPGYADAVIRRGTAFGQAESGIRADTTDYPNLDAFVVVDGANVNRFAPRAGTETTGALTTAEVRLIASEALKVTARTRAQVRKPLGSRAGETVVIVDSNGVVLSLVRSRDALVDAVDVTTQKARTAAFFSNPNAAAALQGAADARYVRGDFSAAIRGDLTTIELVKPVKYLNSLRQFLAQPNALAGGAIAYSARAVGNLARPNYPDGIPNRINGPLSLPFDQWSEFKTGLEYDLDNNQILFHYAFYVNQRGRIIRLDGNEIAPAPNAGNPIPLADVPRNCTGINAIPNGIQLFGGGFPIYRGNQLVGAIAASGDGTDQSDLVSFLGLHNASLQLTNVGHAAKAIRADVLTPLGARVGYVQCPQSPFLDSNEQFVCEGK